MFCSGGGVGLSIVAVAALATALLAGCTTGGGGDGGGDVPSGDGKFDGVVEGEGTGLKIGYISLGDPCPS